MERLFGIAGIGMAVGTVLWTYGWPGIGGLIVGISMGAVSGIVTVGVLEIRREIGEEQKQKQEAA